MTLLEAFFLGVMVTLTPSMVFLAWIFVEAPMSEFARRFLPAHAAAVNAGRDDEYADVFIHSEELVKQIGGAVSEARDQVDQLMTERRHRDLAAMAATTAQIETLLRQSHVMTQSLRNVLEFHKTLRSGS